MASGFQISGDRRIANNILAANNTILGRVVEAVEKTTVDVSNHAKANHERNSAHAQGRFETQTGILGKSITPDMETVNFEEVVGVVFTNVEYAIPVEFGGDGRRAYPFMFPALIANQENLIRRLAEAKV